MPVLDRRPALRWLVPGATVAAIAAGTLIGGGSVSADAGLEPLTPAELLVAVREAPDQPLSGTVEVRTDLGLPELPGGYGPDGADPTALLGGTTTLRVWADGPERSRVAILGEAAEYDMVRNGDEVWTWSSADAVATRHDMPAEGSNGAPASVPATPQEAADRVLEALDPTTEVSVAGVASVAGRPVYELILTPRDGDTRVERVALAIDAETKTPLRVQVYSTLLDAPAIDVGFTSVDFAQPDASVFAFTPPAGATVVQQEPAVIAAYDEADRPEATVVGSGWSQVVVTTMPGGDAAGDPESGTAADLAALVESLPTVSGAWGTGRVVDGTLVSAIVTDDGRVAMGAVDPQVLAAALAAG